MRRVVVTGMGMVTPLGYGVKANWERLIRGESGIGLIDKFDTSDLPAKIAGMVPKGTAEPYYFNEEALSFLPESVAGWTILSSMR